MVAISDVSGGVFRGEGLPIPEWHSLARDGVSVAEMSGEKISNSDLLALGVDILIPAAIENVLTGTTARECRARLIVEGANGPTTPEGDAVLADKGIPLLPDIFANAGGVIASYIEWRQAKSGSITKREEVFENIEDIVEDAYERVRAFASEHGVSYRRAALALAVDEVAGAMADRGWL